MQRWKYYLWNGKKYLTITIVFIVLITFTAYILNNTFNKSPTGLAVVDLEQKTETNNESNPPTTNEKQTLSEKTPENVGCNYSNPPCENGYICHDNICKLNRNEGGGGGGGSVPPLIDVGGY